MNFPCNQMLRVQIKRNLQLFKPCSLDSGKLKKAAVAITVVDYGRTGCFESMLYADSSSGATILTRRAGGLKNHGGQWAFPGGKMEPGEEPAETALRELHEEVGLQLASDSVLGFLDDYITRSGFHIIPVVVWGGTTPYLKKNEMEVSSVHRIPMAELFRTENPVLYQGVEEDRPLLFMAMGSTSIASPTAAIWYQFREVALCGRKIRVAHFDQPHFAWS